jgi:hypothetical protein
VRKSVCVVGGRPRHRSSEPMNTRRPPSASASRAPPRKDRPSAWLWKAPSAPPEPQKAPVLEGKSPEDALSSARSSIPRKPNPFVYTREAEGAPQDDARKGPDATESRSLVVDELPGPAPPIQAVENEVEAVPEEIARPVESPAGEGSAG